MWYHQCSLICQTQCFPKCHFEGDTHFQHISEEKMSAIYSVNLADGVKIRQACESSPAQQICYKHGSRCTEKNHWRQGKEEMDGHWKTSKRRTDRINTNQRPRVHLKTVKEWLYRHEVFYFLPAQKFQALRKQRPASNKHGLLKEGAGQETTR